MGAVPADPYWREIAKLTELVTEILKDIEELKARFPTKQSLDKDRGLTNI